MVFSLLKFFIESITSSSVFLSKALVASSKIINSDPNDQPILIETIIITSILTASYSRNYSIVISNLRQMYFRLKAFLVEKESKSFISECQLPEAPTENQMLGKIVLNYYFLGLISSVVNDYLVNKYGHIL